MDKCDHLFVPEFDVATGIAFKVEIFDLLADIKVLMKEYYLATFDENGNSLRITFNNGQKFCLSLSEIA